MRPLARFLSVLLLPSLTVHSFTPSPIFVRHRSYFFSSFTQSTIETSNNNQINNATQILQSYDASQQQFIASDGNQGMGGGLSAYNHIRSLDPSTRTSLREAILTLVNQAHTEREADSSQGRIMLGICASNAPEALAGLKSYVTSLSLPRGMLHGMDIDGVPIPIEDLGSVYIKYSTGGAMTFSDIRKSRRGFDALWRPGDALLETYDGDFRGVYLNVELRDGVFRQFGVLPTDLFMEEDDDDW
ncbi:hypothetical protein HJC23_009041 [Cyclotella cryptica]|uniref:Plastid lipid-associated protein/fibrillin conserved domain-containing protein n=1 Tax=Cyclotella cryptica TaxID=29204 RepID=A0ABD3QZ85_9STRA|eukprot:CCRYP_000646-RA/>CCRYP_000646-RA protein AED:0.11 eAED:0.11 QI:343/1/1/1/0/0/2/284/243